MKLQAERVSWNIEHRAILEDVHVHVSPGTFVGILGPNGSGKSSLLRCLYRVLRPNAGIITLDEREVWKMSVREVAQQMATVLQHMPSEFDFTVEEIVYMGRTPYKKSFERDTVEDHRLVTAALQRVRMDTAARRNFQTLSGGEKQRVLIARALAQQARFLILDEPTNHLDIRHQLETLALIRHLRITALAALHDLNLAARYCDRLYLMHQGKVVAVGTPEEVLQAERIREVFGVGAHVERDSQTGHLRIDFFLDENRSFNHAEATP
jgi:iron complex transport system ATP-binding protein